MWKQKIGMSLGNHYKIPTSEIVNIVSKAGFEAVSFEWEEGYNLKENIKTAKNNQMILQSLHAPFGGSAKMWSEDKSEYEPALSQLLASAEACAKYEIPVLVAHTWIGFDNIPEPTNAGFENYGKLVERAEKLGILVAFENTEGDEHLFALMENFENCGTVGFCWDSGHELCYNHSMDLLGKFGEKLIMTHLNDNLGISRFDGRTYWTDDLHLLPYDGVSDWDYNIARLKKAKKQEILNFELNIISKPDRHENDCYEKMSYEEYFAECYKRACRLAYRYSK